MARQWQPQIGTQARHPRPLYAAFIPSPRSPRGGFTPAQSNHRARHARSISMFDLILGGSVAAVLFVFLLVALLRPERF